MKNVSVIVTLSLITLLSCQKKIENRGDNVLIKPELPLSSANEFIKYTILKGEQYCDKNKLEAVTCQELSFLVKFDSSAIYETKSARNQTDINKLFGFSDNNEQHHEYSARFGWRWSKNALRLFAYVYNNGIMSAKELGTVEIGAVNSCSIGVNNATYIFTLNGKTETLLRASTTVKAEGYKLYPYFGGDELAPHAISIWINESSTL